jgi:dephospho-CoA kinase
MPCSVICISHETGAEGEDVGRLVANDLGYLYVDEEIVAAAAERAGVDPGTVASEEQRRTLARRILDHVQAGGAEVATLGGPVPVRAGDASEEVRSLIREAIVQTAARGNVVIVAHAASFVVEQGTSALRVLVAATPATRIRRLSERGGVSAAEAARTIRAADAGRRDYLKRFYDVGRELPTHYDLVINTDVVDRERAAEIIAHAARSG